MKKAFDIALKDVLHSLRNVSSLFFMFGIPLLVAGGFFFMFRSMDDNGSFQLPRIHVLVANQDEGNTRSRFNSGSIPGDVKAGSLGELVVNILKSDEISDLVMIEEVSSPQEARALVDAQEAGVALIIPTDFSRQFFDPYGEAAIEFYQDPTLTIGPGIVKSILKQFMDGMAGVNIAADIAMEQDEANGSFITGIVVQRYMEASMLDEEDLSDAMLNVRTPGVAPSESDDESLLKNIVGPILAGMMIFYAFYTSAAVAESILREDEQRTLQRLFTTPTPQATILIGKLLSVFLTVMIQVVVLLVAGNLIFGIYWGKPLAVFIAAAGIIVVASSGGVFLNSLMKDTKQGGVIFGAVITITGMLGMISVFGGSADLGNSVALIVPQGWSIRAMTYAMKDQPLTGILYNVGIMLVWSAAFFTAGIWRFRRRYI